MSGLIDRLKAVVEIVGREMVGELRKNQFFDDLGDKGKIKDGTIVLPLFLIILIKGFILRGGVTSAVLKNGGRRQSIGMS